MKATSVLKKKKARQNSAGKHTTMITQSSNRLLHLGIGSNKYVLSSPSIPLCGDTAPLVVRTQTAVRSPADACARVWLQIDGVMEAHGSNNGTFPIIRGVQDKYVLDYCFERTQESVA